MSLSRVVLAAALLSSCTTPGKVEQLDDDGFKSKGKTADGVVGVNDNGQAVLKTEKDASVELQSQQMANYSLRERLGLEVQDMQRCHEDMASLKDGPAAEAAPDIDIPEDLATEEQIGLTDTGELKVRHTEIFTERLAAERKRGAKLDALFKKAKKLNDQCQGELRIVRAKHPAGGTPP